MTRTILFRNHKYTVQAIFGLLCFLVMVYLEMVGGRSYFDEALGLISIIYAIYLLAFKKTEKGDDITLAMLFLAILVGVLSNVFSDINVSVYSICIDVIAETKFLFIFFAVKYFLSRRAALDVSRILCPVAKVFFLFAAICALITQVVDIGMTESVRYGLQGFTFIFPMSFQFLSVSMVALAAIILTDTKSSQRKSVILVCMAVSLLLTTKSSPIFFVVIFFILRLYFKKHKTLKFSTVLLLGLVIALLGTYQIETYLINENAPRSLFFYYGAETANEYFPWGSGFATFGSDQAARNYSELYYRYGFDTLFGMTPESGEFLSDTFWASAIGQFGWIGSALYIGVYIRVLLSFRKYRLNMEQKAFVYAVLLAEAIHGIGSAIISSSAGVIAGMAMALVLSGEDKDSQMQITSGDTDGEI